MTDKKDFKVFLNEKDAYKFDNLKEGYWILSNTSTLWSKVDIYCGIENIMEVQIFPMSTIRVYIDKKLTVMNDSTMEKAILEGYFDTDEINKDKEEDSNILKGKLFCIDAGHGGHDPGAVNPYVSSYQEKLAALSIAKYVGNELISKGADVLFTRDDDTFVGITERANMANKVNATAFVSVHLNSAENKLASGYEVLVYNNKGIAAELGNKVLNCFSNIFPYLKNRGLKERPDLGVLSKTKMPAILVETGFISNLAEAEFLFDSVNQATMASCIANSIVEQFK